jgi:hypothetical protein
MTTKTKDADEIEGNLSNTYVTNSPNDANPSTSDTRPNEKNTVPYSLSLKDALTNYREKTYTFLGGS